MAGSARRIDALSAPVRELAQKTTFLRELYWKLGEVQRRADAITALVSFGKRHTPTQRRLIEPDPAAAPLSQQLQYDRWVASRARVPTRSEDRQWARDRGISASRVAQLRAHNRDHRLHCRGRPRSK
jgi:hypothetical protein